MNKILNPNISLTSTFRNGVHNILVRDEISSLKFPNYVEQCFVDAKVSMWNNYLSEKFDGVGYFGSDPMLDITDPENISFALFADEVFLKTFMDTFGAIDLNELSNPPTFIEEVVMF